MVSYSGFADCWILANNSLINGVLDIGTDIKLANEVIISGGRYAVRHKNKLQVVYRIGPNADTGKACMAKSFGGCAEGWIGVFASDIVFFGLIKTQSPAAVCASIGSE